MMTNPQAALIAAVQYRVVDCEDEAQSVITVAELYLKWLDEQDGKRGPNHKVL